MLYLTWKHWPRLKHENNVCTAHNIKTAAQVTAVNISKRPEVITTGARNLSERIVNVPQSTLEVLPRISSLYCAPRFGSLGGVVMKYLIFKSIRGIARPWLVFNPYERLKPTELCWKQGFASWREALENVLARCK